ncbi:transcriptional regulator with XRE-family HTH domain [Pseudochelatococcus contaminans]|uniref:Transcriptional regulator with XRE-family HTH domain n=2 Tax=Pseudochelatococcus contaminans TaxID=1538103 RepID=A0A7W5Z2G7_9HYPH|nr:transcriptional regulator with XRE-family HTH domain [Pseudochelatococcus contaminans]
MSNIGERVAEYRRRAGLSQVDLAARVGMSQQGIQSIEAGESKNPRKILELARALGVTPEFLKTGLRRLDAPVSPLPTPPSSAQIDYVKVIGEVAAGTWREVSYTEFEAYDIPLPVDSRWRKEDVFALVVRGNSINRQARDGSFVLCLQVYAAPRDLDDGDWVVVERLRGDMIETTVKRAVRLSDGRFALRPDSDDPKFQDDIILDADTCDGDDIVKVSAFVLEFIRPATRF